jgi:CRP-like cAMP-binding protein
MTVPPIRRHHSESDHMLQKQTSVPFLSSQNRDGIKSLPLFEGLSDGEKDEFLGKARVKNHSRGSHIFTQGDNVKSFYIIQSGVVRLFRTTPGGDEITTDILIKGDTICERKVFRYNTLHPDYALCVEDATLLEFPATWLRDSVRKNAVLSLNILSILSLRSLLKDIESEHQTTMSTAQIVACFLQWMCNIHGFDPRSFELPYNKSLIASRLGMKQETFSRTLPRLRENGIDIQGTHVSFLNFHDIDKYTCENCSFMDDCRARKMMRDAVRPASLAANA